MVINIQDLAFHENLYLVSPSVLSRLKKDLLKNNIPLQSYILFNSPFVLLRDGERPLLLSHHYLYVLAKEFNNLKIPVRELRSGEQIDDILLFDKIHSSQLKDLLSEKFFSSQTLTNRKRRVAGQVCPFCRGPLKRQRSKEPKKIINGKKYFQIACYYRHYRYKCDFEIMLEEMEFALFKKNQYPTESWLKKLHRKHCPKCKDFLFEKRTLDGKTFQQCRKTLVKQYPMDDGYCDFKVEQ